MDNVIEITNSKLESIIYDLNHTKETYQEKYNEVSKEINKKLEMVKEYKEKYYESKKKIDALNKDIDDFKEEYDNLVSKFKDDELSNILVSANKEISAKITDRKQKINKDADAMNQMVSEAEKLKDELVTLNAQKKALEIVLEKAMDISKFYERNLNTIISFSKENPDNLCSYFKDEVKKTVERKEKHEERKKTEEELQEKITSEAFDFDSINDIVN